jgi:hypothetical protein
MPVTDKNRRKRYNFKETGKSHLFSQMLPLSGGRTMVNRKKLECIVFLCLIIVLAAVSSGHGQTGRPFVVAVTVSDTAGKPVANDTVMFMDSLNTVNQAITSATGVFPVSLPAGAYTVRIIAPGYPVQYYAGPGTTVVPGYKFLVSSDTVLPITLTIARQGTPTSFSVVSGFVFDSTGKPVANSGITVLPVNSTNTPVDIQCDTTGFFLASVPVAGSGMYRLLIHSSKYQPQYWTPGGTTTAPTALNGGLFSLMQNDTFRVVVHLSTHPGTGGSTTPTIHVAHVNVSDSAGLPVASAEVQFIDSSNYINRGTTDSSGAFTMSLPSASYSVRIMTPGFPVQYYSVSGNSDLPAYRFLLISDTGFTITLTSAPKKIYTSYSMVTGFVFDSTGKPVANSGITVIPVNSTNASSDAGCDSTGFFSVSVPAIGSGLYTLMIHSPIYQPQYWTPSGTTMAPTSTNNGIFSLLPNDTFRVVVHLSKTPGTGGSTTPTQHVVRVRVLDDTGGVAVGCTVQFIDTSNYVRQGLTIANGDVPVTLPGSPYQVKFTFPGYPIQYYDVPTNSDWPKGRIFITRDTLLIFTLTQTPQKTVSSYGIVTGFVQDSLGKPVRGAKVTLFQVGTGGVSAEMMTDSAGYFFTSVPAVPHRIFINASLYPPQYWTPGGTTIDPMNNTTLQVMASDTVMVSVRLSTHPGSGSTVYVPPDTQFSRNNIGFITGHVFVKTTSQPAAGLTVVAVPRDTTIPNSRLYVDQYSAPYSDTVMADGTYRIANLPRGLYWVYTRGGAFINQFYPVTDFSDSCVSIRVDSTGRTGIDFSVRTGGVISGQLTSTVIGNLDTITVYANMNSGNLHQSAITSAGGMFVINGCAAGSWNLSIDQRKGYFIDYGSGRSPSQITVEEGKSVTGVVLQVTRGGFISGLLSPPVSPDSMNGSLFEIALYPDSVLKSTSQFPYEIQTTWANAISPGSYISGTLPAGTYRMMFRPNAPLIPRNDTMKLVKCRSYAMAGTGPIPSLLQSPLFKVVAGDTTPGVAARFATGFSFLGSLSLEGGGRPNWARVDACIKDGNDYITVCHGYVTAGDTMFQLSGLLDEKDYYLRCDADGYPTQWWSPSGAMSSAPAAPYHFSSVNFARPGIRVARVPTGYYNNYTPFWINTVFDSTNQLTVQWNIDISTVVDTFILYSKDRAGTLSIVTKVPYTSGRPQYVWKETRSLIGNQYSYVVVGKGPQYTIRSGTAGYDFTMATQVAADSLWFSVFGDKNGISMNWSAGKNYAYSNRDSIVLYKKTGATGAWSQLYRQGSRSTWLSDNQWDKAADIGKTLYYKLELVSAGTIVKRSGVRSFTIDTAFVNSLSNNLVVGMNEKYTTIQAAVDAARDFDDISVSPGTYVENINLKGKVLSINGNWQNGVPPVIDASGGNAITVPYPAKGSSWNSVNISGFKIQNALVGINASADVSVSQCLFVNVVKQCLAATIDSASMVRAAATDPFNQYNVQMNAWQCTFIGGSGAGAVAHIGSQGTYESSTASSSSVLTNPTMMVPATSFSSSVSVNNSILAGFNSTGVPLDMYGSRGHANFSNCDFWNTSDMVAATYQNQISMDTTIFKQDPRFIDNTNYFLPDTSPLRTMANNMSPIGYDERRMYNNGGNNEPRPAAVQNFRFAIAGPRSIKLTWSALSADQNAVRYAVYRIHGFDSLWYVDNRSQWSPKVSQQDMFSILDTFTTRDTFFTDTTPQIGFPYIYAVAGMTATGQTGEVDFPASRPLSSYVVRLKPLSAITGMQTTILSFSAASFRWPSTKQGSTYTVYKIGLPLATGLSGEPDSAAMRALIRDRAYATLDSFTTSDSVFIDTSIVYGKPYCFVVTSIDSTGMRLPLEQMPFSFSYVRITPATFTAAQRVRVAGQTWNMIGPWGSGALTFANATDLYHWDDLKQPDKLYSQYAPVSEMRPGAGYWFMPARDTVVSADTASIAALSAAGTPSLSVFKGSTGWNQVSSTLPFPVSPRWLSTFTTYEWAADSNQYTLATVLKPWKGYWIYTGKDTLLPLAGLPAAGSLAKKAVSAAQWELRVSLIGKKSRDPDNYCGVVPPSLAKATGLASPEPPQAFEYPQLYFVQPGVAAAQKKLARLYKSASPVSVRQEWTVGISPSSEDMTVQVDGINTVPPKTLVFFVQNGVVYNLRKKAGVSVAAHKETVYGYIVVTSDSREMALYSGNVELRRAYPNPFTNIAFIEFTLPYAFGSNGAKLEGETRNISLDIYAVTGRHVTTLVSGNQPVGFYRNVWAGTNSRGSMVSSGYYIVRLSGMKFQKTSTLFKIR